MVNLKLDAEAILNYMASMALLPIPKKTIFMVLNMSKKECEKDIAKSIIVGGESVPRSTSTWRPY